jgi:S-(hydroxymethyl)glutathione dehydrogenase/alcohol dehydrogenase
LSPHDLISGKQIRGSWGGGSDPDRDFPKFADLYRQGKLPLEKILGRRYALSQANKALSELESGAALRPLLDMSLKING